MVFLDAAWLAMGGGMAGLAAAPALWRAMVAPLAKGHGADLAPGPGHQFWLRGPREYVQSPFRRPERYLERACLWLRVYIPRADDDAADGAGHGDYGQTLDAHAT